jgi:hypothetical protein
MIDLLRCCRCFGWSPLASACWGTPIWVRDRFFCHRFWTYRTWFCPSKSTRLIAHMTLWLWGSERSIACCLLRLCLRDKSRRVWTGWYFYRELCAPIKPWSRSEKDESTDSTYPIRDCLSLLSKNYTRVGRYHGLGVWALVAEGVVRISLNSRIIVWVDIDDVIFVGHHALASSWFCWRGGGSGSIHGRHVGVITFFGRIWGGSWMGVSSFHGNGSQYPEQRNLKSSVELLYWEPLPWKLLASIQLPHQILSLLLYIGVI